MKFMMISMDEINWFFNRPSDLLECKGRTRNQFISFVIDLCDLKMIKWIFEHSKELKITKRKFGRKLFHRVITGSSSGVSSIKEENVDYPLLYWLHENINIANLFKSSVSDRMLLFIDIFYEGFHHKLLDWLIINTPDLFKGIDAEGSSFFHYAALITTPDIMDWLFAHIPELVSLKNNEGKTAFDIAVENNNHDVVDWMKINISV